MNETIAKIARYHKKQAWLAFKERQSGADHA